MGARGALERQSVIINDRLYKTDQPTDRAGPRQLPDGAVRGCTGSARPNLGRAALWQVARALLAQAHMGLGDHAAAKSYVAEILRINPRFTLTAWGKSRPYSDPADLDRHLAPLREAGLPE